MVAIAAVSIVSISLYVGPYKSRTGAVQGRQQPQIALRSSIPMGLPGEEHIAVTEVLTHTDDHGLWAAPFEIDKHDWGNCREMMTSHISTPQTMYNTSPCKARARPVKI
jgi:hypothetical protein